MRKVNKLFILGLSILFVAAYSCDKEEDKPPVQLEPKIDFTYSPQTPRVGDQVSFTGEQLSGSSEITSWEWDFGVISAAAVNTKQAVYTYATAGNYNVTLTASDKNGKSVDAVKSITVDEALDVSFPAKIAWSFTNGTTLTAPNDGSSSPAIGKDGTIYYLEAFAKADSKLIAVRDEGSYAEKKWETTTGFDLRNAPSIDSDGHIYIANWSVDAMFKINGQNGDVIWNEPTNTGISNSTAAVDSDNNVYIGTRSEGVFSWDKNGNLRWQHEKGATSKRPYYSSPAISKDESTVYILMTNGELFALNTADGLPKWNESIAVSGGLGTSLSINGDGTIYFTTNTEVIAVNDDGQVGTIKWRYEIEGANNSGVVVGPNGDLYVGSTNGLASLNAATGTENWIYDAFIDECVPAVDHNGNVYFGSVDGKFHIINDQGQLLIDFQLGDSVVNSPAISDEGHVYVEATDNLTIKLYKIEVENNALAKSPWPKKGQNNKNTGVAK